jgi:endonuclease/exonuclease/phosphatase family metal-dependent hydrolase
MVSVLALFCTAATAQENSLRIATFNAELIRKGPGLLLRDILKGKDPQIAAFKLALLEVQPDIIALQGIDYDLRGTALKALVDDLAADGLRYSHMFTTAPNAGQASGLDLNGNGKLGDADDAHGYGRFNGYGGMAVLSHFPIRHNAVEDFSSVLWPDLPKHIYPMKNGAPFGGADVFAAHRLSSRGHWVVPITTPDFGTLRVMTYHATPPIYDGPEDRNGRRNHDETAFWLDYLAREDNATPFFLTGTANTDPERGSGRPEAINALLAHAKLQNPFDDSPTADFKEPLPGDLRVDYLMPSRGWKIIDHGMFSAPKASRHSLLWVDVTPRDP